MRTIDQFMWGYQPHFRMSFEGAAERALERIGVALDPTAMLVGFRATEDSNRLPICVEPETGGIKPSDLSGVREDGQARYGASSDARMFHSDPGLNASSHARYRDRHRADALAAALAAAPGGSGRVFFVGYSQRVEEHEVHPVISVDSDAISSLPRLSTTKHTNMHMTVSLPIGVIEQLLTIATKSMAFREAPSHLTMLSERPAEDAVRAAAEALVYSVATMTGNFLAHSFYEGMSELVTMPYEGRAGAGALCLAKKDHPNVRVAIRLLNPVDVTAGREFRKVLELTRPGLDLLCDGDSIYGLGEVSDAYDGATEDVFRCSVVARGTWELEHCGTPLMRVVHSNPVVPRPPISERRFLDTIKRVFTAIDDAEAGHLWQIALVASQAPHGTMLVISDAAAEETTRLAPQAIAIEPQQIPADMFQSFTSIDGSLLLAPDGTCHAVGVILDGSAAGVGDAGRGARYNSAIRYVQTTRVPCVVLIVSEDGMIDIYPELAPRVAASQVEDAVRSLEVAAAAEPPNFEMIYKCRKEVERLAFYLNEDQVERSNAATQKAEDNRERLSQMRVYLAPFEIDPRMDSEFFTDLEAET
ncbi:diadenylate cyclase [Kribbella sp. NPDC051770]|uniref:diadenylate cyclase n=1 Tax=Kribbella sp. NPDC051770 TaxID=3155413 RepID=UPI003417E698